MRFVKHSYLKYLKACEYMLEHKTSLRVTADHCGVSKSSLQKFIHKKLLDPYIKEQLMKLMLVNWSEKHLRGGISTKELWEFVKKNYKDDYHD